MDGLRKYGPLMMLIIMSLSFSCLAVDSYCEASEVVMQCHNFSDSLVVDDIDLDQYECDFMSIRHYCRAYDLVRMHTDMAISSDLAKAKISHDLKIGLVRRYSPGDGNLSGVNYVWTFHVLNKNNGIGCNTAIPLFFCIC